MMSFGREPKTGLVVMTDGFMFVHRKKIISLSIQNKVPVVSDTAIPASDGGLLDYGSDNDDLFRRAAVYADRILRGERAADFLFNCG